MVALVVEFPPLLAPGLHPMTLVEIRQLCVIPYPLSATREPIMNGIDSIVAELQRVAAQGELWVDGSFLTEKIDPGDSDVALRVDADFFDTGTPEQQAAIAWLNQDLKPTHHCDSYVFFEWPAGHPLYWRGEYMRSYWIRQFGFSRGQDLKGMAVIKL